MEWRKQAFLFSLGCIASKFLFGVLHLRSTALQARLYFIMFHFLRIDLELKAGNGDEEVDGRMTRRNTYGVDGWMDGRKFSYGVHGHQLT